MNSEIQTTNQTTAVASFTKIEVAISEVVAAIKATQFDVMTPKGITQAREVRAQIRALRINLGKAGKAAKNALNTEKRRIDSEVDRLTDLALSGEDPLHQLIKEREDVLAKEKREREEKERARKVKIQDHINYIAGAPNSVQCACSSEIEQMLAAAEEYEITAFFEEFTEQAENAKQQAVSELIELLDNVRIREELDREREAEKERLEAQKREQDERQAVLDAEQARIDKEKAEAEQAAKAAAKDKTAEEIVQETILGAVAEPEPTGKTIKELADAVVENTLVDDADSPAETAPDSPVQNEQPAFVPLIRRLKREVLLDILEVCNLPDVYINAAVRMSRIELICKANLGKKVKK